MILSLIVFVSPAMLSFGNIAPLSSSLNSVPPYLSPLSQIFFQIQHIFLLQLLLILLQLLLILLQTSLSNHQISLIPFLVHPLMNKWKMNRSKTSYPTLSLGPLLLLRLKILHKTFHLITQLEYDPFLHIYLIIIVTLPLLHCMSLTPTVRLPLTLYGRLQ